MILGITASGFAGGLTVSDDFNRADGPLGVTPSNSLPWQTLSGSFAVASNKAVSSPTTATSGLATVDNFASNVELSLGVSSGGGDALYFRVVDANNWWRVRVGSVTTTETYTYGHYEYYWCSYRSGAEYYPTTAQYGAGCQQTYHDHVSDWPTRCAWGTSSTSPPASIAYNNYSHSHSITLYNCGQTVTFSHTHYASAYYSNTTYVIDGSGTTTVTTVKMHLEKSVAGTITQVGEYNSGNVSSIQVTANGNSIIVKADNNTTARISTTDSVHSTATRHGIGRGTTSNSGTSMDNFSIIPIGAP